MPVEETLARVRADVEAGQLGRARDRLHGLIAAYPDRLDLRREIAGVYWALHHPAMAGRYWYLEEVKTPQILEAVAAFERACGHQPLLILQALKFRGSIENLVSPFARSALQDLHRRAGRRWPPDREGRGGRPKSSVASAASTVLQYGCLVALAAAATLAMVGFWTVARALF